MLLVMAFWLNGPLQANDLYLGAATADISPELPVALMGQFHMRIAETADTPLYAGIVAIESRDGQAGLDTAVLFPVTWCIFQPVCARSLGMKLPNEFLALM